MFNYNGFGGNAMPALSPPHMRSSPSKVKARPKTSSAASDSPTSPTGSLSSLGSLHRRNTNPKSPTHSSSQTQVSPERAALASASSTTSRAVPSSSSSNHPGPSKPPQQRSTSSPTQTPGAPHNRLGGRSGLSNEPSGPRRMWVRARFDFEASDSSALSFRTGDVIEVLTMLESGWWDGMLGDTRGWFPSNFVEEVDEAELEAEFPSASPTEISPSRNAGPSSAQSRIQTYDTYGINGAEGALHMDGILSRNWGGGAVGLDDLAREMMGGQPGYDDFGVSGNDGDDFLMAARQRAERTGRGIPAIPDDEQYGADEFGVMPLSALAGQQDSMRSRENTGGTVTQANHANRGSGAGAMAQEDAWIPKLTPDGQLFYHNTYTGEDSWELPLNTPNEDDMYGNDDDFFSPLGSSSRAPFTASSTTSNPYPSTSADTPATDDAFRAPPSAQGELPYPWVARITDDGSEWYYVNQHTGETSRQLPRAQPSAVAESFNRLELNAAPRQVRRSVEIQRKAVMDLENRTKEALKVVLAAKEKPTMASLIEDVGDSLRQLFEACVAGSAAEEEMSRASALGSQPGEEAAIQREESAQQALKLAHTSILSSVRGLLLSFGYVGPLDSLEDMPRPAWVKDISVIGCLGLLSANVHAAVASKWTPLPDSSIWPEVMRSATKLKEAIAAFPASAFPNTPTTSMDSLQGKALEAWLGIDALGEYMNGRWGFGKDANRPLENPVIAESQKLKEDFESLTAGAVEPAIIDVLRIAGKIKDTLLTLDIASIIDIDFEPEDAGGRSREDDVRTYTGLVRRAQAALRDLDAAFLSISSEISAIYLALSGSSSHPFEPLEEAIAICVSSLITLLAASQEQAVLVQRGAIKGFIGRRAYKSKSARPTSMTSAISRRSAASTQSYLDSKRYRVHGIEEEFLDPEDMVLERLDPEERQARLAMTGMAGGRRISNDPTPQISPAGSASQVSLVRPPPVGPPPASATSSTTSLGYQKTESDGASTKGSNRASFMRAFMRGRSGSDADPARARKQQQPSQKLAKILGEDPGRLPFASSIPPPQANETVWYLADDYLADEIIFDEKGGIRAGSLKALVARLTPHGSTDTTFFQAFMLTFRSFTSGDELLDLLFERYAIAPPEGLTEIQMADWTRQKQTPIRLRVSNVLRSWLDVHYTAAQDSIILDRIEQFATTTLLANGSETLSKTLTNLVQRRRTSGDEGPRRTIVGSALSPPAPLIPRPMGRELRLTDIDPRELARQLTMIEHANFQRIKPVECLRKAWNQDDEAKAPNVRRVIHTANKLAGWVSLLVLEPDDAKSRAQIMKYFITTAMELKALYNFSSMAGVVAGLNAAPVDRLKRTKELLNTKTISLKAELDKIMDSSKNFSNYKDMLKTINPPCVPFFGFYLSALTFIEDGNKDFLQPSSATSASATGMPHSTSSSSLASISAGRPSTGSSPPLINFFKRSLSAEILRDIQQYQSQPYNLARCRPVYEFLMISLDAVEASGDLYNRSLALEPREKEEERIMLHDSGFI